MRYVLIAPFLLVLASSQATAAGQFRLLTGHGQFQLPKVLGERARAGQVAQVGRKGSARHERGRHVIPQSGIRDPATPVLEPPDRRATPAQSFRRAYLGVQLQAGALVGDVENNGPAQAAGIQPGDLIAGFDGKKITGPDQLLQIVAQTPPGKEVVVGVNRGGKEGTATVKLGDRLVPSRAVLDAYRQKLGGMLQELESLGAARRTWNAPEFQRFSDLFAQFEALQKTVPLDDGLVRNLWAQLERDFTLYKPFAENLARQKEALAEAERRAEEDLPALYLSYMTLQVCGERFQQFDRVKSGLRGFLINKELSVPHDRADALWNSAAENFTKIEGSLERVGNVQFFAECEQVSRRAATLTMPQTGDQGPPLRKKDF